MSTINYTVTVASAKFLIDGAEAPKLTFRDGDTYVLDQADSSNAGHILKFSATSDNSGSSVYSTGVTIAGTPGSAGASTTVVTSSSTTDTLYYFSAGGAGYGEEFSNSGFNTSTTFNLLKPIVGAGATAEKWGPMINHALDQIDQGIDAASEIADGIVSESKLQVSNAPTDGYVLTARSSATGDMTWEANAATAGEPVGTGIAMAIALG